MDKQSFIDKLETRDWTDEEDIQKANEFANQCDTVLGDLHLGVNDEWVCGIEGEVLQNREGGGHGPSPGGLMVQKTGDEIHIIRSGDKVLEHYKGGPTRIPQNEYITRFDAQNVRIGTGFVGLSVEAFDENDEKVGSWSGKGRYE